MKSADYWFVLTAIIILMLSGCTQQTPENKIKEFAARYTAAWCSQDAGSVASFYAENGSLKINSSDPSVGREAITKDAQGFMTAFPDLKVEMDSVIKRDKNYVYYWTLTGTNTGPGGTGKPVRINGYEEWTMDSEGLIAESKGYFDEAEYKHQLEYGVDNNDEANHVKSNIKTYTYVWDEIMNKGKLDMFNDSYFTTDVVMHASPADVIGIDSARAYYANFLTGFSNIKFTIKDVFGQGDKLVKYWNFKGTHTGDFFGIPATEKTVDLDGTTLVRMSNGKIAEERDFYDNLDFMTQLGLIKE